MTVPTFPTARPRRLRRTPVLRSLVRETTLTADDLIYPIFVEEEIAAPIPVDSMPGVMRIPERGAIMMFGVSHRKDATGSDSWNHDGLIARMVRKAKHAAPELVVISDTCFCEFTDHGHCGVIERGAVANDATVANLARQAVVAIEAGADMVAPSAMMDGQVAAIRSALDAAGHAEAPIMAY